jgi:hypothetical protein
MPGVRSIIEKISAAALSLFFTIICLGVAANYYLLFTNQGQVASFYDWIIDKGEYTPQYLFWGAPWCDTHPDKCTHALEKISNDTVARICPTETQPLVETKTIVFLGDSFTTSPWSELSNSYPFQVARLYADRFSVCVRPVVLAMGGTGASQQLAFFEDHVASIQPDIVIWQFYFNDVYENNRQRLHLISFEGTVSRRTALRYPLFWAGYINQHIPLLRRSTLGQHALYVTTNRGVFSSWEVDEKDATRMISENNLFISSLLKEMDALGTKHSFRFITTVAPLECRFDSSVKNEDHCLVGIKYQDSIIDTLTAHGKYVSMEESTESAHTRVLGVTSNAPRLFNTDVDPGKPGYRHLSIEGNAFFSSVLFENIASNSALLTQ